MDKDFMMDLCNKLEDLVDDDNLMMEVDKTCSVTIDVDHHKYVAY